MAAESTTGPRVRFAALIPLTGNAADQGEWARRGFELALEEERAAGGRYEIAYEDTKGGDPAVAVQAYKNLIARGKPEAVLTYGSGVGMALTPLVNGDQVVQMGIATATPKYTSKGDYTFRNFPSAVLEADFLSEKMIEQLHERKIAIVNINNDFGVGAAGAVKKSFLARGGEVVYEDSFNPGDTDFKPLLLKLKGKTSLVYLAVYPADGALLLRQAKDLGLQTRFIASAAIIGGKDFFSLAGDAAEGLFVSSTAVDDSKSFSERYAEKYPGESTAQQIYAARAYDAVKVLVLASRRCATISAECLKTQLLSFGRYSGASGNIEFDENGDIKTSFGLFQIKARGFVPVSAG